MASRFPLARLSITATTATRNRVAYNTRRNFATEAVPENFVAKRKAVEEHAKSSSDLWKKVSLFVCPVALLVSSANALMIMKQHEAHNLEHPHHEVEHPPFDYQKIRHKPFFWGDGDHTLFHNPAVNGP
ncbi:cytochrome oxidase subunit VI [Glomus cerebriforme]|uniref:Cytochrome c oxidase subunit n=1 Tax=Glomus cerebriforme TaxID=658196 RepID=A0A397SSX8_9GLOM|nr:cytochrome oxidase subunit VI [Glomus cerebriforme]